ncbi:MAG: anthranilate synthase component I family protein [Deltaproteobacteria bacterium]|nr:anthranilate synthase component I family protein [Deltaproteobacteria bacterium]
MAALRVVSRERLADMETPVSAYLKLCRERPDSFLLESVETKDITGRYSIVACDPISGLQLEQDKLLWWDQDQSKELPASEFFDLIRSHAKNFVCEPFSQMPAVGSLMGFVGYDAVRLIERLPAARPLSLPVARLVFPSRFVVFDHRRKVLILLAIDADESACAHKVDDMEQALKQPLLLSARPGKIAVEAPPRERFYEAVKTGQEYIKAGDIFQVVLSDDFGGETDLDPFEVYRRLRVRSPSPYMFFLDFGEYKLIGSSPETLVKVDRGIVTVRPIAGTRGRSDDPRRDKELEKEMMTSEKELAEHIMLVDLGRNDVGRVSQYGTVTVDPYMSVERYSHVMHVVSQVQGVLREDADAVDAFIAGFPAGTVSGAPKVRAMEIIDELEQVGRGPYAGAVGYFGPNGRMDTCIAIRTVLFQGDRFTVRVGAGIVADSVPEMEYKEIQNKAAQSLFALQAAAEGEL